MSIYELSSDVDVVARDYLIQHGVLRPRAMRWKRVRQYVYTAECWMRHEIKERERLLVNMWRSIDVLYTEAKDRAAYQALPLRDRTRYEKIISLPRPLTPDEYREAAKFILTWREKANRCE